DAHEGSTADRAHKVGIESGLPKAWQAIALVGCKQHACGRSKTGDAGGGKPAGGVRDAAVVKKDQIGNGKQIGQSRIAWCTDIGPKTCIEEVGGRKRGCAPADLDEPDLP